MSFDPTKPVNGVLIDADFLRAQFNALNDLISAVPAGPPGPQGPPFANAVVDAVNTAPPGSNAAVSVSFDGTNVHFVFGLPAGFNGINGTNGTDGAPGEVTTAALTAAIAGTAQDPAAIAAFPGTFSDPPTQGEMQAFAAYVETLRAALVR